MIGKLFFESTDSGGDEPISINGGDSGLFFIMFGELWEMLLHDPLPFWRFFGLSLSFEFCLHPNVVSIHYFRVIEQSGVGLNKTSMQKKKPGEIMVKK